MWRHHAEEVIEAPHAFGERFCCENPAAAQTREAVGFRQATGDHEIGAQQVRSLPRCIETRFQINFVDQDVCAHAARDFSYHAQFGVRRANASGIVQVGNHDEARARRNITFDFAGIELETRFEFSREAPDLCSEIFSGGDDGFVGRLFD
jgi:hypothetical protein